MQGGRADGAAERSAASGSDPRRLNASPHGPHGSIRLMTSMSRRAMRDQMTSLVADGGPRRDRLLRALSAPARRTARRSRGRRSAPTATRPTGAGRSRASAIRTRACCSSALAPAAHGANRTGRVFTGDGPMGSGDFLMARAAPRRLREHPDGAASGRRADADRRVHRRGRPLRAARQQADAG